MKNKAPNEGKKIHTVIFDLDGTLSNSGILTIAAFKHAAPLLGLPIPSEEAIQRATGYANPEFYYILYPDYPRDTVDNIAKLVEDKELRELNSLSDKLLFEGCRELLLRLKEEKIRLNIASTGDEEHVFSILEATGIIDYFEKISCGRPDKTEMLRELTEEGDRSGYIMVGDMRKDYEAARANGILSVGACYGYCKRELADFDLYIDRPLDLLKIIKGE